jgi:hypothetical protein
MRVGGRQVHGGQPTRLVHPPHLQLRDCPRRSVGHVAVPAWAGRTQLQLAPASKTRKPTTPSLSRRPTPTTNNWCHSATCMYTPRTVRTPLPTPVVTHASQCRLTYPSDRSDPRLSHPHRPRPPLARHSARGRPETHLHRPAATATVGSLSRTQEAVLHHCRRRDHRALWRSNRSRPAHRTKPG